MNSVTTTPPDELSIEFNHTADDYLALVRDMFLNEPSHLANALKQSRQFRAFALFVLGLVGMLIFPAWVLFTEQSKARYFIPAVMFVLIAIANFIWKHAKTPQDTIELFVNTFRERMKRGSLRPLLGNRVVRINRLGMQLTTDVTRELIRWDAIARVVDNPTYIFIFAHHNEGWAIPKSAFVAPEDAAHFIARARAFHEHSAGSVKTRLADSDELCFACGYNLRGSDGQVCPECGIRLLLSVEKKATNTSSDANPIRPLS